MKKYLLLLFSALSLFVNTNAQTWEWAHAEPNGSDPAPFESDEPHVERIMQKIYVLLLLLISSVSMSAQKANALRSEDRKEMQGLTVQLRTAPDNTYLFDIMKGPILLNIGMRTNPATMLPGRFETKADAFKVAECMIKQYRKGWPCPWYGAVHVLDELED